MQKILRKLFIDWSMPITLVFVVLALLGAYYTREIELKLSLTDLLPQEHPAVQKFNKLVDIVGGVGYVEVVMHADDKQSHLKAAEKIVEDLRKNPLVRSAFYLREEYFFLSRVLYYGDTKKLQDLKANVEQAITRAKRKIFDIGLWDEDKKADSAPKIDPELEKFAKRAAGLSPYLLSDDKTYLLVMIKPNFDSLDMVKSRQLVDFTQATVGKYLTPGLSYRLSGRYYSKVADASMIEKDIYILGILSNLVMALVLLFYFRSIRGVISIFIPVILGLGMTALATRIFIGHINIVTGFLVGIISGVGSDYGIHMLWRLRLEKREPSGPDPDPLWRTLTTAGWANFVTIISSGLCFFMMMGSSFKVFSEFGFICGFGLTAILVAKLCSFYWTSKLLKLEEVVQRDNYPFRGWTLPVMVSQRIFVGSLILAGVLMLAATQVGFEFDFDKMMQHSKEVAETSDLVDRIYDRSTVPSAFAARSREEAIAIEKLVKEKYMPGTVQNILSGATIVPEDQAAKEPILASVKKLIDPLKDKYLERAMNVPASSIRNWVQAKPFTFSDLPVYVQEAFRGTRQASYLIYVYPASQMNNAKNVEKFAAMVKDVENHFPDIVSGSDAAIFSDILTLIQRDGIILLSLIVVGVGLFIWFNMRDFKEAMLCYLPFLASLPISIGLMAVTGIKFNIFNTALLPAFVAVGIEIPIQLMQRAREIHSGFKAVRDIAVSLQLSLLTTALGFGTLVFTRAGVLKSMGWISLMATGSIWAVGLFLQPAILERYFRWKDRNHTEARTPSPMMVPES